MASLTGTPRARTPRSPARRRGTLADGFGVFAECLLTGVWVALAALPLVTLPAALAAGSRHLARHVGHEPATLRLFAADFRRAVRRGWLAGAACWAAAAVLAVDVAAARAGVPGAPLAGAAGAAGLLGLAVVVLRAAAHWAPGASWRVLLRAAARRTVRDPVGSCLLLCGPVVVGLSGWLTLPLAAPALGVAVAAALAVERRADAPR